MKKTIAVLTLLCSASLAPAQNLSATARPLNHNLPQPMDEEIQALRKGMRSAKKQIVASNLELSDLEAERFWPVYDRFAEEQRKIHDRKIALIKEYAYEYSTLTDQPAVSLMEQRAAVEEDERKLRGAYMPLFAQVLPGRKTALFFQIEWRVGVMLDVELASAIPVIEP